MKVPISWLKDFIDVDVSAKELADKLTMTSLEVEGIEEIGKDITNVIIGQIKKIEKHPNADKLKLCVVFDGQKDIQIITAAENIREGQKIPVALEGTKLATGIEIKKTKLRGIESFGMMCSPIELGIDDDAKGIVILDESAPLGINAVEYLDLPETVLDIATLPNRSDCLSIIGIAREAGAAVQKEPNWMKLKQEVNEIDEGISAKVEVIDKGLCPRYMAREIKDVKIAQSPKWMQKRLKSAGIRPINNVVDITNYVLIEMGQPLHAFDFNLITGGKIIVRRGKSGEKITTLDGVLREVNSDDLLITDIGRPIALAGVMGGAGSEVTESTNHILLESAYFNPVNIRRTSFKLGHHTESSQRFERGVDIVNVEKALDRASYLLYEYAGGKILKGKIDIKDDTFFKSKTEKKVLLNIDKLNKLLGIVLKRDEAGDYLKLLDYEAFDKDEKTIEVKIPSWRIDDVFREADLCEEVARLYGYNNIPSTLPSESIPVDATSKIETVKNIVKEVLLGGGLSEVVTYSLVPENSINIINSEEIYKDRVFLDNPLSTEDSVLRNNMLFSLLNIAKENINRQNYNFGLFEFGKIFYKKGQDVFEKVMISGVASGKALNGMYENNFRDKVEYDFYFIKGIFENVLKKLFIEDTSFEESDHPSLQAGKRAIVKKGNETLGTFGEINSKVKQNMDLSNIIYYFEIDLKSLVDKFNPRVIYQKISKFPVSEKDIAILIDEDVKYAEIENIFSESESKILKRIELFDKYEGEGIGKGKASLAFHLIYGSSERTLTEEEINKEHDRLKNLLVKKLKAEIR